MDGSCSWCAHLWTLHLSGTVAACDLCHVLGCCVKIAFDQALVLCHDLVSGHTYG